MVKRKKALITGVTGQDGSYLSEFLLSKGYEVHGLKRRSSSLNTSRIDHIYQDPHQENQTFFLHYGDLTDSSSIFNTIKKIMPDEIYNLGAQSHVGVSFQDPEYTANCDGLGALRILEAIRLLNLESKTKYYQASTSELFGLVQEIPQKESTPFYPRSPYAIAKLYAYWITVNYRESYKMFACNGILFNHESPRRGETFVTRKITRGLARISKGLEKTIYLGNIDAKRDWGHAKDYVIMQWLMLQQNSPKDYVIASGKQVTVRKFIELTANLLNWNKNKNCEGIIWEGVGLKEIGRRADTGEIVVKIDPRYYRPSEVETLLGDSSKAKEELDWCPKISMEELINEMLTQDLEDAQKELILKQKGFDVSSSHESNI